MQVNAYTSGSQREPSVALAADGDFAVAWVSLGSGGTESDQESVQMALFRRRPGALWVPGFEVAAGDPEGPTTFFAVRNTSDEAVEVDVAYHGKRIACEPLRTDVLTLGPRQTLTPDVRADLTGRSHS